MNEKLLDELLSLKAKNKELEQKVADLEIERDDLRNDLSVEKTAHLRDKERFDSIIACYESGIALKQANEDAEEYKKRLVEQEGKLNQYMDKVEELESELSSRKSERNPFGAGRKRDKHLEVYLLGCWAKEMSDKKLSDPNMIVFPERRKWPGRVTTEPRKG